MASDCIRIRVKDAIFLLSVIHSFRNCIDLLTRNKVSRISQHIKSEIENKETEDDK